MHISLENARFIGKCMFRREIHDTLQNTYCIDWSFLRISLENARWYAKCLIHRENIMRISLKKTHVNVQNA